MFRGSTSIPCERTGNLKQERSVKLLANGTALLILIPFLLLFTGGHSALTWVVGFVTLICAVLVYVAAVLWQSRLYKLRGGINKKGSPYALPTKRGS